MTKLRKFGTFAGVFTPSILTILGVIMYLRLPFIVGSTGLLGALGIILVAHIISATTGLSVSSIATDKKIEGGGTYYMISRSMGLPIGGTLGLALFVGLSFSVSLYLIGFSESFLSYFNYEITENNIRVVGTIMLVVVTLITLISTTLAIKTQFIIMGLIILSLISIFAGVGFHTHAPETPLLSVPIDRQDYIVFFGIFFPAVTGFEAGVSMSGDLKDPKRSIPYGTIMAIVVGLVVYIILSFFLYLTVDQDTLLSSSVLQDISWNGQLVTLGIWGATLSSALGSILGAPRILQAIASDNIVWNFFGKGSGTTKEPRNALIMTFLIAEAGILIGELDAIAEIVSIFFITTYGFLNLSCAFESWTSADFRPTFRTPVWVSLLGAIAAFVVMIQLNIVATIGAVIVLGLLFVLLKRKELTLQSGDAWSGVWASLVKMGLQRLGTHNLQSRNWRPNILMFNGGDKDRQYLVQLGVAMAGKLGILSAFELEISSEESLMKSKRDSGLEDKHFFSHKHYCRDVYDGIDEIARVYGFSGVEPNTILMGWTKKQANRERFLNLIANFQRSDYNSIFLSYHEQKQYGSSKTIDVWWSGWGRNLSLAVNLLRHISTSSWWKEASVRLLVVNSNTQTDRIYQDLSRIVDHFRVEVEIRIVQQEIGLSRNDIIARESANTDLCIIGIPENKYDSLEETDKEIAELISRLGSILFINASSAFEEYDLGLNAMASDDLNAVDQEEVTLPAISPSRYPAIANDIVKVEKHGRELLDRLYKRSLVPYFSSSDRFLRELMEVADSILSSLRHVAEKNPYKRAESLFRIRKLFYKDAQEILSKFNEQVLNDQLPDLSNGLEWYIDRLDKDLSQFPKRLEVNYLKEDFIINKSDPAGLKWLKLRKRLLSPFAKKFISGKVRYREVAGYYLRDSRYYFITQLLTEFLSYTRNAQLKLLHFIELVDKEFENLEKQDETDSSTWELVEYSIHDKLETLIDENTRMGNRYKGRMLAEFNRNLQLMSLDLERININALIKKRKSSKRWLQNQRMWIQQWPERWSNIMVKSSNKVAASAAIRSLRVHVRHEIHAFNTRFDQVVDSKILKPIAEVKDVFGKKAEVSVIKGTRKVDWSVKEDVLMKDFEELEAKLTEYIRTLPAELSILDRPDNEESEGIVVPLSKISQHFVDTSLLGPFHDAIEGTLERMKTTIFNINDQLSLAIFNLDNASEDGSYEVLDRISTRAFQEISREEARLVKLKENLDKAVMQMVEEFMEPLSIYKLHKTTEEFSHLLRDYHGRRVATRFGKAWRLVVGYVKQKLLFLLYSRSEGILLARRYAESIDQKSINERTLELVDKVSPDDNVLKQLPHYYQNLFSGRSSIGENFWVRRPVEESKMAEALDHYRQGYHGGVLILGERNVGKTTLCRYVTDTMLKDKPSFHLFPPAGGSSQVSAFAEVFARATGLSGELNAAIGTLPNNAVLVIHDLELWWNRSVDGLEVIETLIGFIKQYGNRILFIVNMNPFAYELICKQCAFEECFIAVVPCQPFSSMDIQNLIISRHRSSGLDFVLEKRNEKGITDLRLARMFNSFFNYSNGNPGVAMNGWLNSVVKITGTTLWLEIPDNPDVESLENLPDEWNVILVQLALHKRMSVTKLSFVMNEEEHILRDRLQVLKRSGLVKERTIDLFMIDPYVESFLVDVFKEKLWL